MRKRWLVLVLITPDLQMEVVKSHGCICLMGLAVERTAADALSYLQQSHNRVPASCRTEPSSSLTGAEVDDWPAAPVSRPHVTLVTKEELAACSVSRSDLLKGFQLLDPRSFFAVGIAISDTADAVHTTSAASSLSQQQQGHSNNTEPRDRGSKIVPKNTQAETQTQNHVLPQAGESILIEALIPSAARVFLKCSSYDQSAASLWFASALLLHHCCTIRTNITASR